MAHLDDNRLLLTGVNYTICILYDGRHAWLSCYANCCPFWCDPSGHAIQ